MSTTRPATAISKQETLGGLKTEIDFEPFLAAARLLYEVPCPAASRIDPT